MNNKESLSHEVSDCKYFVGIVDGVVRDEREG